MARKPKNRPEGYGTVYEERLPNRPVRYVAQIYVNGKKIRRVSPTKAAAYDILDKIRAEHKDGKNMTAKQPTLSDWRQTCHNDHFDHLRPNVREDYDSIGRTHIDPYPIAKMKLEDLNHPICQRWLNNLVKSDRKYSYYTIRNARAVLRRLLGIAKVEGLITSNPAAELRIPLQAVPENERPVEHTWTLEEARKFLKAIRGDRLEALFYLALTIGARLSEICGLRWCDIDLQQGTVFIRKQIQRLPKEPGRKEWVLQSLKRANAQRRLHVDEYGLLLLRERQKAQQDERQLPGFAERDPYAKSGGGLVFTSQTGGPIHGANLTAMFKRQIDRADVSTIRFHDLRHTCASLMLAANEALTTVSGTLGHKSPAITMQFYSHLINGEADGAISRHAKRLRED